MRRFATIPILVAFVLQSAAFSQDLTARFDATKLRQRVKTLSSDEFEGRGPGTPGGRKAAQYIASQLRAAGVRPGNKGSYFQNVRMVGVKADPATLLTVSGKAGKSESFKFADDFVATTSAQRQAVALDSELVFVGYGIEAPNYKWNDYKGTPEDFKGKVLMMLVNDPPATDEEPELFGGKALTYYGRWTYKYEEAARRGAAGVILIHTNDSAGYGWNVIRTSNGGWRYEIARRNGDTTPFLDVKSWVTSDTAEDILETVDIDLDDLRRKARSRDFRPVKTGVRVRMDLKSEMRSFESPNVVGTVPGSDRRMRDQYVVYTSHWDHLGVGEANENGDRIYNGAYDNASGVASVIGIAEVLARTPMARRPKRSFLFVFTTAEEQGLLGAEYYARNPIVPIAKTAANINMDGVNFFGKTLDFSALGAERSSLLKLVQDAADERKLRLMADTQPEQGFFFRSDHFPFALAGVPAISLRGGTIFAKPLTGEAEEFQKNYNSKYYHQVTDEYRDWWDTSAMIQMAELGLAIGVKAANTAAMPRFNPGDEFFEADTRRFRQ